MANRPRFQKMTTTDGQSVRSNPKKYTGVVAAMITPCSSPGVVDPAATEKLCVELARHGCDGLFITSSTGEAAFLDEDDRRILTTAARKAVTAQTLIYAGISGLGLPQTIRYAKNAAADGADVAVVMAPFLFKISQPELSDYLLRIADASPIPLVLYHHFTMPSAMTAETVARVAEHENIVGVKDTSTDITRIKSLIDATAGMQFSVFQGSQRLFLESMLLGADGMVAALANFVPEIHAKLYQAVRNYDAAAARQYQDYITKLLEAFILPPVKETISALAGSVKLAAKWRGWLECTDVLMPGFKLDDNFRQVLEDHLAALDVPSAAPIVEHRHAPHYVIESRSHVA